MGHMIEKDAFFFVVAEDQGIQAMIAAVLSVEGFHRVMAFARAKDILQSANAVLPDVYIVDYDISGMTGLELCERLQPDDKYIPCILLNAPHLPEKWEHRPLWTLQMPFTIEDLLKCLQEALHYVFPLAFTYKNCSIRSDAKRS